MSVFQFTSYRKYMLTALESNPKRSGAKTRAAESMDVQPAFLSRVLAGQANLNLEQADKFSQFSHHTSDEHHQFLLLVQYERAGTASLKSYFLGQIERGKSKQESVSEQIKPTTHLSVKAENRYYSSWIYAAVHVLLSIESLQTAHDLSKVLNLPQALISEVLSFLAEHGLATIQGDRYQTGPVHLHLKKDSDQIQRHHANWRMKSIETLAHPLGGEVRYSAVLTLNDECASRVREELVASLKKNLSDVEQAPAETAYVYTLDFFPLLRS